MHVSSTRVLAAAALGGVALSVWGMIWWMGLSMMIEPLSGLPAEVENAVVVPMIDANTPAGAYFVPFYPDTSEAGMEAWTARHRAGPIGLFLYQPDGMEPMEPVLFVRGYVMNLIACLLACVIITPGVRSGWSGGQKLVAVVGFGVVVSLMSYGNLWNWMHAPTAFAMKMSADVLGGWVLAGVVIAAVLKAKPARLGDDIA